MENHTNEGEGMEQRLGICLLLLIETEGETNLLPLLLHLHQFEVSPPPLLLPFGSRCHELRLYPRLLLLLLLLLQISRFSRFVHIGRRNGGGGGRRGGGGEGMRREALLVDGVLEDDSDVGPLEIVHSEALHCRDTFANLLANLLRNTCCERKRS